MRRVREIDEAGDGDSHRQRRRHAKPSLDFAVRVRDPLNERRNANETLEIAGLEALLARHAASPAPTAAGDALVFHTFLLHCSQPNRSAATRWTLQARYFDFLNPTAIRHDWVGGMNEGVDFRRYHPELVADG